MSILKAMIAEEQARRDTEAARVKAIDDEFKGMVERLHAAFQPFAEEVADMKLRGDYGAAQRQGDRQAAHVNPDNYKGSSPYSVKHGLYVALGTGAGAGIRFNSALRLTVDARTPTSEMRVRLTRISSSSSCQAETLQTFDPRTTTAEVMVEALLKELVKNIA